MPQNLIFLPMAALAFWTFAILVLVPLRRFRAAAQKKVSEKDFKFGESARVPGEVSIPNRAYMNLLEAPVLFYVVSVLFYVTNWVDGFALALGWTYVVLRVIHSLIHLTYNKPRHRAIPFAFSCLTVFAMWVLFVVRVYG